MQGSGNMQEAACMEAMLHSVNICWETTYYAPDVGLCAGDDGERHAVPALNAYSPEEDTEE